MLISFCVSSFTSFFTSEVAVLICSVKRNVQSAAQSAMLLKLNLLLVFLHKCGGNQEKTTIARCLLFLWVIVYILFLNTFFCTFWSDSFLKMVHPMNENYEIFVIKTFPLCWKSRGKMLLRHANFLYLNKKLHKVTNPTDYWKKLCWIM